MTATDESMDKACQDLLDAFFERYPNDELRDQVGQVLARLLGCDTALRGNPGGWAGGIVYAVGSRGCGVPGVMNADLEKVFGARMATIRRRAMQVKNELDLDAPLSIEGLTSCEEFTLRDEANAICAYAFRNGPIEDIHADGRISDPEMKHLMIKASESLAKLMAMKRDSPEQYDQFIRDYHHKFCLRWER
jgi:hypothetical protein